MPSRPLVAALVLLLAAAAPASARTTLDRTLLPRPGGAFQLLRAAPGERHVVRRGPGTAARASRERTRRSLIYFGQLTDSQIEDEMSPLRVDFLDAAGRQLKDAWRPQESLE